jgi:hypothetical protein
VVEGGSPDGERAPVDVATPGPSDAPPSADPAPAPPPAASPCRRARRRRLGPRLFRLIQRAWIPLVIVAVLAAGGLTVSRLHGLFGSQKTPSYGDTRDDQTTPIDPKVLRYEIFGPPGTVADVSYFDANGDPAHADGVTLPWSLEFPITGAAGIGSIAAQGDSETLGCRILIDGAVKSEKISHHEVATFTSCLLKAA